MVTPTTRHLLPWVAVGGAVGSLARHLVSVAVPHDAGGFAWSTLIVNVTGSLLLGVLMGLMATVWAHTHRWRPFLGVGVLGGYTTFSTAMLDLHALLPHAFPLAMAYVAATLLLALAAAVAGQALGQAVGGRVERRMVRAGRPGGSGPSGRSADRSEVGS